MALITKEATMNSPSSSGMFGYRKLEKQLSVKLTVATTMDMELSSGIVLTITVAMSGWQVIQIIAAPT